METENSANRKYFIEEIKFYNNVGTLYKTTFLIYYMGRRDVGMFRYKWIPCRVYIEHDEIDYFGGDTYKERTDFTSEWIAKQAITNFLSKGIELPTQISKIII